MKLVIEIDEYKKDGVLNPWAGFCIEPADKREGISVRNKSSQTAKLARLIDLSEVLKKTIEDFYKKDLRSASIISKNISTDPTTL